MKMRDKKKKKLNRIVKAGLALLCAGALLGGAVFGGGSVRVKAEDEDEDVDIIWVNSSSDENGNYSDLYYYLKDSNGDIIEQGDNADIKLSDENASTEVVTPKINYHVIIDSKKSNYWGDYGEEISYDYSAPKSRLDFVKNGIKSIYDVAVKNQSDMTLAFSSILDSSESEEDDNSSDHTYTLLKDGIKTDRYDDALGKFEIDNLGEAELDSEYVIDQIKKEYSSSVYDVFVLITNGSEKITDEEIKTIKKALKDEFACLYWVDVNSVANNPYGDIAKKIDLNGWDEDVLLNKIQCLRIRNTEIEDATLTDAPQYYKSTISITLGNGDVNTYSGEFYVKKTELGDNSKICVENVTSTEKGSYIVFSSKDESGVYATERNKKLYDPAISLSNQTGFNFSEKKITYNLILDLGVGGEEENALLEEIKVLSQPLDNTSNKIKVVDCDGKDISLEDRFSANSKKKLTGDNLRNIFNNSQEQSERDINAYIIVTDTDGIEATKDVIEKEEGKLIYYINTADSENNENVKEITDNAETGVSKWGNARNMIASSVVFYFEGVQLTTDENGDSTTPVSIIVDSVKITNVNIYVVDDNKNIIVKIWSKLRLWQKILIIAGAAVVVVLIVIMIIVSTRRKKARKRRKAAGGIPHGSPSSSPDVQLRSGVSPTAQTNVLARRAGEQNMQGMQNTVPANNTKQIQIQIIGRNPKIINTYINGSIFVGRANTCDVFINDATISRQHFALECVNGEVFIQPLVATNGTKLNGQRINDKHPLYPNDRIQIGTVGIIVRW